MIEWLDNHLVPEWRKAWKRWSIWLGAVAGTGVTMILQQPQVFFSILSFMPVDPVQRALAAAAIGIGVWAAPSLIVLLKQKNLSGGRDEPTDPAV